MKIRTSDLTNGASVSDDELTSLKDQPSEATTLIQQVDVPVPPKRQTRDELFIEAGYNELVLTYINVTDYEIADNLREAVKLRVSGKRFISMREADILARGDIALKRGSLFDGVLMNADTEYLLCEGTPGCEDSGWHLRFRYNSGVEWLRARVVRRNLARRAGDVDEEKRLDFALSKGRDALKAIQEKLDHLLLYLWPDEIENGFAAFLLKPEFMTTAAYSHVVGSKISIGTDELSDMVNAVGGSHE